MLSEKQIFQYLSDFFGRELRLFIFCIALALIGVFVTIFAFKISGNKLTLKFLAGIAFVVICAVGLITLQAVKFIPIYRDYVNKSYTVQENCELYIYEGMDNPIEQRNNAIINTEDGTTIHLKIVNDYKFETEVTVRADVVYTQNSKHIIWYETEQSGDGSW